jgi:hypothetical protein
MGRPDAPWAIVGGWFWARPGGAIRVDGCQMGGIAPPTSPVCAPCVTDFGAKAGTIRDVVAAAQGVGDGSGY